VIIRDIVALQPSYGEEQLVLQQSLEAAATAAATAAAAGGQMHA
jgi:hypothetical protein